jgi:hypothetical protein
LVHNQAMNKIERPNSLAGYEQDFARWSAEQAALLREGRFEFVDLENVAEEIESLGRSDKREIRSRVGVVLLHLLKWEHQIEGRKPGWLLTLNEQREKIRELIVESPSLAQLPAEAIQPQFRLARMKAASETKLSISKFPSECPYSAEQVLSQEFLPGPVWPEIGDYAG